MNKLFDVEVEKHFLGCLLQFPASWGEVSLAATNDFSTVHQPIFQIIKQQLDSTPPQPVTPVILADKLKSYNVDLGVDAFTYLDALRLKPVKKEDAESLMKDLKLRTFRRDLLKKLKEGEHALMKAETFDEMLGVADKAFSGMNVDFFKVGEVEDVFGGIEAKVEALGNNPIDPSKMGYTGVFPSIDRSLGALLAPSSLVNISARQGSGKSSFGFFYNVMLAEKHNFPILWTDAGEMTLDQLQFRAVCCLSHGKVPLWAVRSGQWRLRSDWTDILRKDVWPRVKKLKMDFRSVAGMTPKEKIGFIKRYYYNKVGRGNFLAIVDDYLKGVENMSQNSQEYQSVGYYVADIKSLVTDDITASFWTSTQANRMGISKGKKASEIVTNDSAVSLSDRINHNATHSFFLRYKVPEELAIQGNMFGNMALSLMKTREGLGMDYEQFMMPIKTSGGFEENYFHLGYQGFNYTDKGWHSTMLEKIGKTVPIHPKNEDNTIP